MGAGEKSWIAVHRSSRIPGICDYTGLRVSQSRPSRTPHLKRHTLAFQETRSDTLIFPMMLSMARHIETDLAREGRHTIQSSGARTKVMRTPRTISSYEFSTSWPVVSCYGIRYIQDSQHALRTPPVWFGHGGLSCQRAGRPELRPSVRFRLTRRPDTSTSSLQIHLQPTHCARINLFHPGDDGTDVRRSDDLVEQDKVLYEGPRLPSPAVAPTPLHGNLVFALGSAY